MDESSKSSLEDAKEKFQLILNTLGWTHDTLDTSFQEIEKREKEEQERKNIPFYTAEKQPNVVLFSNVEEKEETATEKLNNYKKYVDLGSLERLHRPIQSLRPSRFEEFL